ncbi:MAG: hypothetical protein IJP29_07435 [Lachnospiraceae bacterium]|nr:hypothetical protein [Lachnospiraceae bacterium]
MDKETLIVEGFVFPSYKEAQIAQKELVNIEAIRKRIRGQDGKTTYELYCKLVERDMFHTMLGYGFLFELRHQLMEQYGYREQELPDVVLPKRMEYDKVSQLNQTKLESKLQSLMVIKTRMTITIVALLFVIVGMFIIVAVNPNVGYVNTENKIINKYSTWEEELNRREQAIREKEEELKMNKDE